MKNKQVIIVGDSFNNTLGLIRSLGEAKVNIVLLLVGDDRLFISRSKYLKKDNIYSLKKLEECLPIIKQLYDPTKQQYIICSNDKSASYIDEHEDILYPCFNTPMRGKRLGSIIDKEEQCILAENCGFTVPKSFLYERGEDFPKQIPFPILLKPANSNEGQKSDIHICYSSDEVIDCLSKETNCRKYIVQEYIEKEYEINLIGVSTEKGVFVPGVIKKLRHYPTIYSPCSYGKYMSCEKLCIDISPIKTLIREVGYYGPFSVELIHRDDINYFMEVNFRHDGLAYTATAAGANLLDMYINESSIIHEVKDTYMMDLSIDFCHVKDGHVSMEKWLIDFLRTACQLNFNWKDSMPTLCYYWKKIFSKFSQK